jgi:hypothetical protein
MLIKKNIIFISLLTFIFVSFLYLDRYKMHFDATSSKRHELSDRAVNLINRFVEPVTINVYTPDVKLLNQVKDELYIYQHTAEDKMKVSFHNRAPSTSEVKNNRLNLTNILVAEYKGEQQYIDIQKHVIAENNFIKMLETLNLQSDKWVVFSLGNGERNPFSNSDTDIGYLMSTLQQQGIKVASFNLDELATIPSNASLIVFSGPTERLSDKSASMVREYVQGGGSILWLSQTGSPQVFSFLNDMVPIRIDENISVDQRHAKYGLPSPGLVLGRINPNHDIYPGVDSLNLFPWAHKLSVIDGISDWSSSAILMSDKEDILAIEAKKGKQSVVVFGTVDFVSNGVIENYANANTIVNTIRWQHMQQKPLVVSSENQVSFVISNNHEMLLKYLFQLIIPIMLLIPIIIHALKHLMARRNINL